MPEPMEQGITELLDEMRRELPGAADKVARRVFGELHRLAESAMRRESEGHTLQPTELVDEAFIRLMGQHQVTWQNRNHFYAIAAQTIRRILIDHARQRLSQKRDFGLRVTLDDSIGGEQPDSLDLIALDDALQRLDALAPRQAKVVELRFFGGLENDEVADVLALSPRTVKRDWTFARAFLLDALATDPGAP
ncbi:MAG: sigma-70 family RNA polymerase sigma factor [Gemmatimonadales bacterium]